MFYLMPTGRIQSQFIEKRKMPENVGGDKRCPAENRVEQDSSDTFERMPNEKRPQNLTSKCTWQAGKNWKIGCAGQDQGRSQHHQQQMLNHVDLQ